MSITTPTPASGIKNTISLPARNWRTSASYRQPPQTGWPIDVVTCWRNLTTISPFYKSLSAAIGPIISSGKQSLPIQFQIISLYYSLQNWVITHEGLR
ncbi:hypothetical protein J2T55_001082 [Methylohalomonas lacus]|uniref:Uncharacterized protein n=1 Tax=Methylohalomonas lacus TaxID=398773 RepID=A0AAE3HJU1_9GAMM|nr:hypothetical protein [Methylohalomonas lacus]